jgi:hypothetical protein
MSEPLPFCVSKEAEYYLGKVVAVIPEMEAGISLAFKMTIQNRAREITDCYDGPHFNVGWHKPGVWSCAHYQIAGREFFFTGDALEALRGKTLTVPRRYEGGRQRGKIRDVLVAV